MVKKGNKMDKEFLIQYFGSQAKTARALGVSRATVTKWADVLPDSVIGRVYRVAPAALDAWNRDALNDSESSKAA